MSRPRAVAYLRVSTGMQERDGVSLDAQREMAKKFCALRGFELADVFLDVISGTKDVRPGLARLEKGISAKTFDHVLVYKIDRLSRDPAHYHQLLKTFEANGIGLGSLTQDIDATTSMGRFILNIMIALSALESEQTGERMRDSIRHRASQGRLLIGKEIPFGYIHHKAHTDAAGIRHPGRLEVHEGEAETVRWFYDRFLDVRSIRLITKEANASGRRRRGQPWNHQSVRVVLRNPLYAGMHAALKTKTIGRGADKKIKKLKREEWLLTPHDQPAIVSKEDWDRVQAAIEENAVPPRLQASRVTNTWSGLVKCAGCGGGTARQTRHSGARKLGYYLCTSTPNHAATICPARASVSERFLDEIAAPAILARVSEAVARDRQERQRANGKKQARKAPDPTKALERIAARRSALLDAYEMRDIGREEYRRRMDAVAEEERSILAAQDGQEGPSILSQLPENLPELWARYEGQPAKRGHMLRTVVHQVVAEKGRIRVRFKQVDDPAWPHEDLVIPIQLMRSPRWTFCEKPGRRDLTGS